MVLYTKNLNNRINEVDFFRGIAIIFMIIFHGFYFYDLIYNKKIAQNKYLKFMGLFARNTFIFLMGMSIGLSSQKYKSSDFRKRALKRSGMLLLYAITITVVSRLVLKDKFIRFGILHFMAISMFILAFVAYCPVAAFGIGLVLLLIYENISQKFSSDGDKDNIIKSSLGYIPKYQSIDYFPVTKWFWISSLGLLSSQILFTNGKSNYGTWNLESNEFTKSIVTIGKYSLEIYLAHLPVIYGIIYVIHRYISKKNDN